jgi:hypothetical protein
MPARPGLYWLRAGTLDLVIAYYHPSPFQSLQIFWVEGGSAPSLRLHTLHGPGRLVMEVCYPGQGMPGCGWRLGKWLGLQFLLQHWVAKASPQAWLHDPSSGRADSPLNFPGATQGLPKAMVIF